MGYEPQFTITHRLLSQVEAVTSLRERILGATVELAWIPALQKDTRHRNAGAATDRQSRGGEERMGAGNEPDSGCRQNVIRRGPMRSARIYAQTSDDGGSAGRAEAAARRPVRGRDCRWGWTRGSHIGRELAEWMVVRVRSRWRGR